MKRFLWLLPLLCSLCWGQGVVVSPKVVKSPSVVLSPGSSSSITYTVTALVAGGAGGAAATFTTGNATVTSGAVLIAYATACAGAACTGNATGTIAFSDSNGGNTWVAPSAGQAANLNSGNFAVGYACNAVGGTYDFTVTVSGGNTPNYPSISVAQVTGSVATSACGDTTAFNANAAVITTSTPAVATGNTAQSSELCWGGMTPETGTFSSAAGSPNAATQIGSTVNGQTTVFYATGPTSGSAETFTWTLTGGTYKSSGAAGCIKHV